MTIAPKSFRKIRMELAREPAHPGGDRANGYLLYLPLDDDGLIDAAQWREHKQFCAVVRFRPGQTDKKGLLRRKPGGAWYFDYDASTQFDDEAGYRFGDEHFVLGEYVSVLDEDGEPHTYRIVSVEQV